MNWTGFNLIIVKLNWTDCNWIGLNGLELDWTSLIWVRGSAAGLPDFAAAVCWRAAGRQRPTAGTSPGAAKWPQPRWPRLQVWAGPTNLPGAWAWTWRKWDSHEEERITFQSTFCCFVPLEQLNGVVTNQRVQAKLAAHHQDAFWEIAERHKQHNWIEKHSIKKK